MMMKPAVETPKREYVLVPAKCSVKAIDIFYVCAFNMEDGWACEAIVTPAQMIGDGSDGSVATAALSACKVQKMQGCFKIPDTLHCPGCGARKPKCGFKYFECHCGFINCSGSYRFSDKPGEVIVTCGHCFYTGPTGDPITEVRGVKPEPQAAQNKARAGPMGTPLPKDRWLK